MVYPRTAIVVDMCQPSMRLHNYEKNCEKNCVTGTGMQHLHIHKRFQLYRATFGKLLPVYAVCVFKYSVYSMGACLQYQC